MANAHYIALKPVINKVNEAESCQSIAFTKGRLTRKGTGRALKRRPLELAYLSCDGRQKPSN